MTPDSLENIDYDWILGPQVSQQVLEECSSLYSNNYGFWGNKSPRPRKRIVLSANRIKALLDESKDAALYRARINGNLIGYAIAMVSKIKDYGIISWVIQFVVHEDYRNQDVGKNILFSIWGFSNHQAWGVMSANPYAVRALEKATRRRCDPEIISRRKKKLLSIGKDNVPYIEENIETDIGTNFSKVNTKFFVDHSGLEEMIASATSKEVPWLLGCLEEGWEWFAFTFQDQEQMTLTAHEIEKMINVSDQLTKKAYSRMLLNSNHQWMRHTEAEVNFIVKECRLNEKCSVLDLGCGIGRHSIALAKRGLEVIGIDYIAEFISKAKSDSKELKQDRINFIEDDCRSVRLGKEFDAVLCLYDVVGSFVDDKENLQILACIAQHLKPDGTALISVMNYELTESQAQQTFSFRGEPNKLLGLKAGNIMEQTGNIFKPDFYLIDRETHIVYRKEQFTERTEKPDLPIELIVRDRRFKKNEMEEMCNSVGMEVKWSRYVSAGRWDDALGSCDSHAKEILVLCRKRGSNGKDRGN